MYIFGFDNSATNTHIVAAVCYVMTMDSIFINWFAVSPCNFDKKQFGNFATDKPFQNMGNGSFMLLMLQLQASNRQYSISIHLQANMQTVAAVWYHNCGFSNC